MTQSLDFSRVPDDAWQLHEVGHGFRRYRIYFEDGSFAQKTEYMADDTLIALNQHKFNESIGKRWGDGKIVAEVPLNVMFNDKSELSKKMKEGDKDHVKWWLNSEAARPYRTFKGRV